MHSHWYMYIFKRNFKIIKIICPMWLKIFYVLQLRSSLSSLKTWDAEKFIFQLEHFFNECINSFIVTCWLTLISTNLYSMIWSFKRSVFSSLSSPIFFLISLRFWKVFKINVCENNRSSHLQLIRDFVQCTSAQNSQAY